MLNGNDQRTLNFTEELQELSKIGNQPTPKTFGAILLNNERYELPNKEFFDRLKLNDTKKASPLDIQVSGNHYKQMKIQPVEFITVNNIPFIEGCVIKYICRHSLKNGLYDLKKAKHFIDLLIELKYKGESVE